ncbi:MAG: hypothetical protein PUK40_01545 [Actinomycetaceae bacterium]|nr:hypothetical protein [Arcanobacterium sp.]MDD7504627.1 hypothetical protein [Actinomycetaceae bacterium]MDY6143057.1 hypothetical protein [Arcanobacterium sp.]
MAPIVQMFPAKRYLAEFALGSVGTFAYYATPDFVKTRPLRAIVKTLCTAEVGAVTAYFHADDLAALRTNIQTLGEAPITDNIDDESAVTFEDAATPTNGDATDSHVLDALNTPAPPDGAPATTDGSPATIKDAIHNLDWRTKGIIGATAVAIVGINIALMVGGEKWIYRRAERARLGGRRYAHTKQAVVIAGLTGLADMAMHMYDAVSEQSNRDGRQ